MKKIIIKTIKLYQITPLHCHSKCRFTPTCSNYMIEAISTHGTIEGVYLGIKRILRCNPLSKWGYDPVPNKKEKQK